MTSPRNEPPEPAIPLEYGRPPSGRRRGSIWWGIAISVIIAGGVGSVMFGLLMANGWRDDYAGPIAFGMALLALGGGLAGTVFWTRRSP